jgi:chromosome segregation ATPase
MKNELKDRLDPYFNEIKDLIKSTAKSTETVLRKEIEFTNHAIKTVKGDVEELRSEVNELRSDVNELRSEMKDMESRLSDKIDTIGVRLEEHESKPAAIAHPS